MGKSEQTRAYIIEKTAPIFNSKGYAGTSISDITDATKLTKGSVYGNFADKDEVALAAFDYNIDKVNAIFSNAMAACDSAKEKLLAYADLYSNYERYAFPVGGCPLLNTATESDDTHPELRKKVSAAIINWKKSIVRVIEKGIEDKEFPKTIHADQVALTIIAMLEGSILIARATGKTTSRNLVMQSLRQYIEQLQ